LISSPLESKRLEPVKVEGVAIARPLGEAQARKPPEQDRQRLGELEPRQRRADAEVNAGAETHMGVRRPLGAKRVGFGEALGIAVGGAEQKADFLALEQLDAGELYLLQRVAVKEMERRIEAQQFLDRRRRRAFVCEGLARVDPLLEHELQAIADRLDRRLVTGVEQQDHGGDELVLAKFAAV